MASNARTCLRWKLRSVTRSLMRQQERSHYFLAPFSMTSRRPHNLLEKPNTIQDLTCSTCRTMTMRASRAFTRLFTRSSLVLMLALLMPFQVVRPDVVSGDRNVPGWAGRIRYHYDAAVLEPHATVVIVGVGTGMATGDYDEIAKQMTQGQNATVIFADPVPGLLIKLSATLFARQVNSIVAHLADLIPSCSANTNSNMEQHCISSPRIVIGGHSAGGAAAFRAVLGNLFTGFEPAAFLGLDPWYVGGGGGGGDVNDDDKNGMMKLPSMYWGFSHTTCGVNVGNAAKAAYGRTNDEHRVLVQIQNANKTMKHCSFTDTGCPFICDIDPDDKQEAVGIREGVGSTLQVFLHAVITNNFDRSRFEALTFKVATKLFVGKDNVPSHEDNTRLDPVPA